MFDALQDRFSDVFRKLRGRGRITEDNVREVMRDVRTALLEADVHLDVVKTFTQRVTEKAVGEEVIKTLNPDELMVKIVHDELVGLMGPIDSRIPWVAGGPTVILMAGLQGSGKTTTCAKLAKYCIAKGKKPMMVAADLKRPAAIDQLETLGQQLNVPVYVERDHQNPVKVCRNGVADAKKKLLDVVILDTAGRLSIDEELMKEVANIAGTTNPHQIYLVLDAMTGQDAVNTAKHFNERLELDGVIMTKFDSDTRGGAILSVKSIVQKPIKFIGVGEKLDRLEEFHPDRMAGRILGMGDIVSLVEQAQQQVTAEDAAKLEAKMAKGQLSLDDFINQMDKVMGGRSMKDMLKMIPGVGKMMRDTELNIDEGEIRRMKAIVHSMTPKEKENPKIIDASRRRRIARGSGAGTEDVSGLCKQFLQARDVMKSMAGMSMMDRMKFGSQFAQMSMAGQMPQVKSTTRAKYKPAKRDKRKQRKRKSR
ncbi:MAG: signal recognition particle protein [Phycisphaerales bacterium]|nr:signal recognition particle protein [Phycisphaerales bacterium]MCB9864847.1 signal recognition particle protein [Phycisphaerales bacterium]